MYTERCSFVKIFSLYCALQQLRGTFSELFNVTSSKHKELISRCKSHLLHSNPVLTILIYSIPMCFEHLLAGSQVSKHVKLKKIGLLKVHCFSLVLHLLRVLALQEILVPVLHTRLQSKGKSEFMFSACQHIQKLYFVILEETGRMQLSQTS